jgi:hypothetical protein
VGAVAKRFVGGKAATAKGNNGSPSQAELISGGIDHGELALDADGSIVDYSDFCRHVLD